MVGLSPFTGPAQGHEEAQSMDENRITTTRWSGKEELEGGRRRRSESIEERRGGEEGAPASMACSTSLCLSASITAPASCSSSSRFLSVGHASSISSVFRGIIQEKQSEPTLYRRSHMRRFLVFASADVPQTKRSSGDNVVMVDPLEAKRLATRQMQEIRVRETLKKRRQAEAINGALAMIGLTAGLIVEGQTGKGILAQLAGYLAAISSLFGQ